MFQQKAIKALSPIDTQITSTMSRTQKETPGQIDRLSSRDSKRLIQELIERIHETTGHLGKVQLIAKIRRIFDSGLQVVADEESTVSFREAAEASISARMHRRPSTCRDLRHFVRRLLRVEGVENRPLRAMNSRECRVILEQAFPNSKHSYNKGRAIMNSIFAYGQRREWCSDNPVSRIEPQSVSEKEIHPLQPEEIQRLETTVRQPQHEHMRLSLHLMLYCGLRPQEVARLQQKHIQWEQGRVIVPAACSKTGGGRVVPLRKKERLESADISIPRNWKSRWKQLRRSAGFASGQWVPDVCRHTFASYHAAYFRNLPELQLEMGHRSADLLRTRYLNLPEVQHATGYWN